MNDHATFGELLRAATAHLDAADPRARRTMSVSDVQATIRALLRMVTAMSHCLAVVNIAGAGDGLGHGRAKLDPWTRARAETRQALDNAAALLRPHTDLSAHLRGMEGQPQTPVCLTALRLARAARTLQAGQDLLQTHFKLESDGLREPQSRWAHAIISDPATNAMLIELAMLGHRAAAHASDVALAPGESALISVRRDLNTACQWIWTFANEVKFANNRRPVPMVNRDLLNNVPLNVMPPRRVPQGGEIIAVLRGGAANAAERAWRMARAFTPHAMHSPAMTTTSLLKTASAATVTSHNCEVILTTLASSPDAASIKQQLLDSATAAGRARQSWLAAARSLEDITTDTRGYTSAAASEINDLTLWTGRLAYANPEWTPAAGPRHTASPVDRLAPMKRDLLGTIVTVHHVCDTLDVLARESCDQIRLADRARRILVPTRSIPHSIDTPYAFVPAPQDRITRILSGYDAAAEASQQVATLVAATAEMTGAPRRTLLPLASAGRSITEQAIGHQRDGVLHEIDLGGGNPGPLERALRQIGTRDHELLRRASVLDREGRRLVIQAAGEVTPQRISSLAAKLSLDSAPIVNHAMTAARQARSLTCEEMQAEP